MASGHARPVDESSEDCQMLNEPEMFARPVSWCQQAMVLQVEHSDPNYVVVIQVIYSNIYHCLFV